MSLTGPAGAIAASLVTPVPDTGNTQFDVVFPAEGPAGFYGLTIGPDILAAGTGLAMDQNANGTPGEVPGDQFLASFQIFGPRVTTIAQTGLASVPIPGERVTFNTPIDPSTFSAADVTVTGPGGTVPIASVIPVTGTGNTQFDITFASPITTAGNYTSVIGPDVSDDFGNPMDQNQNGVPGEAADTFTSGFTATTSVAYRAEAVPIRFVELAGDPTATTIITTGDDSTANVPLGADTFNFYGVTYAGSGSLRQHQRPAQLPVIEHRFLQHRPFGQDPPLRP